MSHALQGLCMMSVPARTSTYQPSGAAAAAPPCCNDVYQVHVYTKLVARLTALAAQRGVDAHTATSTAQAHGCCFVRYRNVELQQLQNTTQAPTGCCSKSWAMHEKLPQWQVETASICCCGNEALLKAHQTVLHYSANSKVLVPSCVAGIWARWGLANVMSGTSSNGAEHGQHLRSAPTRRCCISSRKLNISAIGIQDCSASRCRLLSTADPRQVIPLVTFNMTRPRRSEAPLSGGTSPWDSSQAHCQGMGCTWVLLTVAVLLYVVTVLADRLHCSTATLSSAWVTTSLTEPTLPHSDP